MDTRRRGRAGRLARSVFAHSSCSVDRIEISAGDAAFDTDTLKVPAEGPFTIVFKNNDSGIEHGFAIYESREAAKGGDDTIAAAEITSGPDTQELNVAALDADEYFFWCDVHQDRMRVGG